MLSLGLALVGGIIVGLLIAMVLAYFAMKARSKEISEDFVHSQEKVMKNLQKKKDSYDKELSQEQLIKREELRQALQQLDDNYNQQK